jgi:chitinase
MINKSALRPNTRIILAFASFNFSSTEYIPGLNNMSINDLIQFTNLIHSNNCKASLSIGGATYPFYGSDLFNRPGDLANNINILLKKCNFDGVDFDIEDVSSNVPSNFANNAASLINTLRSLNKDLNITFVQKVNIFVLINYFVP